MNAQKPIQQLQELLEEQDKRYYITRCSGLGIYDNQAKKFVEKGFSKAELKQKLSELEGAE